jgi:hypothetical protein
MLLLKEPTMADTRPSPKRHPEPEAILGAAVDTLNRVHNLVRGDRHALR